MSTHLPQPACRGRGVCHSLTHTRVVGGAVPRGGVADLVPCGNGFIGVFLAQGAWVVESL